MYNKTILFSLLILSSITIIDLQSAAYTEIETKVIRPVDSVEIIQALINNDKEHATKLIQSNLINLNFKDELNRSALSIATEKRLPEIVKLLLEHGANVNITIKDEWTPLVFASINNFPEIVKLLLEYGATDGKVALMLSSINNAIEAIKILLEHGINVNNTDNDGWTVLMHATIANSPEVIKLFLEYDADINLRTKNKKTALDFAQMKKYTNVINLLKSWGNICKFRITFFEKNKNYDINDFKLYPTSTTKSLTVENVFFVLKNKNNGNTLLHEAVTKRDYNLIDYIFKFNFLNISDLLNIPNNENMTPIDLAVTDEYILNYFMQFAYPPATKNEQTCIIS